MIGNKKVEFDEACIDGNAIDEACIDGNAIDEACIDGNIAVGEACIDGNAIDEACIDEACIDGNIAVATNDVEFDVDGLLPFTVSLSNSGSCCLREARSDGCAQVVLTRKGMSPIRLFSNAKFNIVPVVTGSIIAQCAVYKGERFYAAAVVTGVSEGAITLSNIDDSMHCELDDKIVNAANDVIDGGSFSHKRKARGPVF